MLELRYVVQSQPIWFFKIITKAV